MTTQTGKQSITFEKPPWIISSGCVAGTKEAEGPIGHEIDLVGEDDNFGCDIWEEAESTLQKEALTIALGKAGLKAEELRYLFAGDLLGQSMATSFGLQQFDLPLQIHCQHLHQQRHCEGHLLLILQFLLESSYLPRNPFQLGYRQKPIYS